jgi:hypothetical protein
MVPLNARVNLDEAVKGFAGGVGVEAVGRERNVDPLRYEQQTPGYALVNLRASYWRGALEASGGVENLLNKGYELPLGGVNMDGFLSGMQMGAIELLTGRERSGFFSLTASFKGRVRFQGSERRGPRERRNRDQNRDQGRAGWRVGKVAGGGVASWRSGTVAAGKFITKSKFIRNSRKAGGQRGRMVPIPGGAQPFSFPRPFR